MCFSAAFVNFAGLPLDIFGVILLFRYGLPPDVQLSQEGGLYPLARRRYAMAVDPP